jgi:hypothetical protein
MHIFRGPFNAGAVVGTVQIEQFDDADIQANRIPKTPQPTRSLEFQIFVDNYPKKEDLKNCPQCGSTSLFRSRDGAKCMACNTVIANADQSRSSLAPKVNKLQPPEAAAPSQFVGESSPFGSGVRNVSRK